MSVTVHGANVYEVGLVSLAVLLLPPRVNRISQQHQFDARSRDAHGEIVSPLQVSEPRP